MGAVRGTAIAVVCCLVLTLLSAAARPPEPTDLPPAPGTLLLAEPTALVDPRLAAIGVSMTRIRYASRSGLDDRPVEVTGVVFTPAGRAPRGGWPVVSFAHGSTGLADHCAPSTTSNLFGQLGAVLPFLRAGYLVTATDYEGLGTPGPHPYLQPLSEARSVIDAVTAARELVPAASRQWIAVGVSQGGQAAWATAERADRRSGFLGAVALAPPTDMTRVVEQVQQESTKVKRRFYLPLLASVQLAHPEFRLESVLSGGTLAELATLETGCLESDFAAAPVSDFVPADPEAHRQLRRWLAQWTVPSGKAHGPLFVAAGGRDRLDLATTIRSAVRSACSLGAVVDHRLYPEADHPALPAAFSDVLTWVADRFAGRTAPDTCPGLEPGVASVPTALAGPPRPGA